MVESTAPQTKSEAKKKAGGKKFLVHIDNSSHVKPLLEILIKENATWQETLSDKDWRLKWVSCNADDEELVALLSGKDKMVNRYPDAKKLAHKDTFSQMTKIAQLIDREAFSFIPPTFTLPSKFDAKRLDEYMCQNKGVTYIAKPQVGAQGDGMALFKEFRELPYSMEGKDVVVQRYLDRPLLMDQLKFDLRVYVVLIGIGESIKAYICDDGLARFCTVSPSFFLTSSLSLLQTKYEKPTKSNFKQAYMHLTNYSVQKMSEAYIRPSAEDILKENNATKRTITSLIASMKRKGIDSDEVWRSVREACTRTMQFYIPMLQHTWNLKTDNKNVQGKPFQVLGLDLLIDSDLKAWLLEINDHPSLNIYFDTSVMGGPKMTEEDIEHLDLYVKSRLTTDSILLAKKKDISSVEQFNSLSQIYPSSEDEGAEVNRIMCDLQKLFYKSAKLRQKHQVSSQAFEKLAEHAFFKKLDLKKVDLSLSFQAATNNAKAVEFLDFCEMMHKFYQTKVEPTGTVDFHGLITCLLE